MKNFTIISITFMFLSLLLLPGCQYVNPVTPIFHFVVQWYNGEAHKYYKYDADIVYRASKHSCENLGYTIKQDEQLENGNYYIVAGSEDRFKINIKQVEKNISKLSIRINIMGDKPYAELIYEKVDEELNVINYDPQGKPHTRYQSGRGT